ncbi:MAG: HlyD family secretion protein [Thermoleophilales bacterium]|nr:HlyD family secretion protein [Thermoleophilales bacterium]
MSRRVLGIAAVLLAIGGGAVWVLSPGGGSSAPAGQVVTVDRGEVAVTVGGVGHVNTLAGAARLAVPGSAAGGASSAGPSAAGGSGAGGGSTGSPGGGGTELAADAVFPAAAGHDKRLLDNAGQPVIAGQPIAVLADDGATAQAALQARNDLDTSRLELAQKRVHDPLRGLPPTQAETVAGRQAIVTAQAKLARTLQPLPADVATARLDFAKALADLQTARAGAPAAISAAELAVATARHKLELVTGAPDPTDVALAQLELAKATLDQSVLLAAPPGATPAAINAADLAIAAAQQKLADALAAGTAADIAAARAELAKAQSERDALVRAPAGPSDPAKFAAQLAVDAARKKLDALFHPQPGIVSAARAELKRTEAELAALRTTRGRPGITSARAAVTAATRKLQQLTGPPPRDVLGTARFDLRKAQADLAVLRQRGAPADAIDLALARLKVDVASQRVTLAGQQRQRLIVLSPATGTVTSLLTTPGAAVDGATPMARVQDLRHLVVTLDLSEFDVGRTRVGAESRISVDALGGHAYRGNVMDVGTTGANNAGVVTFPVVIALTSARSLRPGMTVSARIVVKSSPDVVRVPVAAVPDKEDPTVMVKDRSGKIAPRHVELGLVAPDFLEVRSGLQAGEHVVVAGEAP